MNALCDFTGKWVVEGHVNYILSCMREKYGVMREKYGVMRENFVKEKDSAGAAFVDVCLSTLDIFEENFKKLSDARIFDKIDSEFLQ